MARFESRIVWQRAQEFAKDVDRAAGALKYDAAMQLRRSAASIPDNIAEGSERGSDRQFAHALAIAMGSCAEAQGQLRRASGLGYQQFIPLIGEAQELGWMLAALRRRTIT